MIRNLLPLLLLPWTASTALAETAPPVTNIVVFDASGSMWNKMEDSTRIEIAREVMKQFLDGYDTAQPLGVIAYGHRKRGDCEDIEVLVEPSNIDPAAVSKQISALLPKGKTPLAESLRRAGAMIPKTSEEANILLITDGLETCGGDPCAVAKEMIAEGIKVRAHVVGFGLTKAEADSLACIAQLTGGMIFNPSNGDELLDALKQSVTAAPAAEEPAPEPVEEKTFATVINLKDTGFGLPTGLMKWTATDEAGKVRELGMHEGRNLVTELPADTWKIISEGVEGRGEGTVTITQASRPYIDFTAPQIEAEILNNTPLTAGVNAYIKLRITTPPPGNAQSQFKIGIFPENDPLTRIIASGGNRFIFAGQKISPGEFNAAVQMPKEPGRYKLAFRRSHDVKSAVIAEKLIEVVAVPEVKLEVPERVVAGSVFSPEITSGFANYDRLQLFALKEDGTPGREISGVWYSTHIQDNEGLVDAPAEPGKYLLKLTARTADKKVSPEATATVNVVSAEEFEVSEPETSAATEPMKQPAAPGKVSVSLMLDGDAEQPSERELMWTLRPVAKDDTGKWIYDRNHPKPMGESKMLAAPEVQWELDPGFWEVSVLVADNRLNRVLIEIDPAADEHAFLISAEKLPKPAIAQPTQWLISAKGGEAILTEAAAPLDPKAKIDIRLTLPGVPADASVTWSINPLEADGVTLSRDGRMGGGGNATGGDRSIGLVPGKWKLSAKSGNTEFLLVADVAPGKAGQSFTLERQFGSGDVKLDVPETVTFLPDGFFPITLEVPAGFKGKVTLHTEADRDGPAIFETDAAELAGATDHVLPMPAKPGFHELQIQDASGRRLLGIPFELIVDKAETKEGAVVGEGGPPKLREFKGDIVGTGTVMLEINGETKEFVTTRKTISMGGQKHDNPDVQKFADAMEGKVVNSAVLRLVAGSLYVTLDAYGPLAEWGPRTLSKERMSFEISFTLDPKTLELKDGARKISYNPPGSKTVENQETGDYELKLEPVKKFADGSLALKGTFSGTLTQDMKETKLDKPVPVKGTFDILQVNGNDAVGNLLRSQ